MEIILFFKNLNNVGAKYLETWINIIQFDGEKIHITNLSIPEGISKTTFYRIINYGIEIFPKYIKSYSLIKKNGKIIITKNLFLDNIITNNKKSKDLYLNNSLEKFVDDKLKKTPSKNKKQTGFIYEDEIYEEIISFLNDFTGKNFKSNSTINKKFITQRLNDGFTIDDFKKVITIKTTNWLNSQMEQFLRPETLFSNKFESYLNETIINNEKKSNLKNSYDQINIATSIINNQ